MFDISISFCLFKYQTQKRGLTSWLHTQKQCIQGIQIHLYTAKTNICQNKTQATWFHQEDFVCTKVAQEKQV